MQDILITILGLLLAIIVLFIFPLMEISSKNDELSEIYIETIVADFVNTVASEGKITEENYDSLIQKISTTRNSYNIQMEVKILDDSSSRATTASEATLVGENKYYSVFDDEIFDVIVENKEYVLKKNDYIIVTVSNTNQTFGAQMRGFIFSLFGKDTEVIVAKSSAVVQ